MTRTAPSPQRGSPPTGGRSGGPRRLAGVVVAAALLATLLPPVVVPAAAATEHAVHLDYTVLVADPGSGHVNVSLAIRAASGVVKRFTFQPGTSGFPVTNLTVAGGTRQDVADGVAVTPGSGVTFVNWTVAVDRASYHGGTYSSYLGATWGVVRAEALGIGFSTRYDARYDPVWVGTLRFDVPRGWNATGPWPQDPAGTFRLPRGDALPEGFVALGRFQPVVDHGAGLTFRYVELGATPSFRGDLFRFLKGATPYDRGIYGNVTGPVILAVTAPAPMFAGGLASRNSLYVRDDGDLETLAHEYVHVWQRFLTIDQAGASTLWLNEGDADYHGPLSLEAAGFWTPKQVDQHFRDVEARAQRAGELQQPLASATYGGPNEKVAYDKGALALNRLDQILGQGTGGRVRLADVLAALNAELSPLAPGWSNRSDQRVTNAMARDLIVNLTGPDLRPQVDRFFTDYVNGTEAPGFTTAQNGPQVVTEALVLDHPVVLAGGTANATVSVRNRGPEATTSTVTLYLNGSVLASRKVDLAAAEERNLTFPLPTLPPGDYALQASYRNATLRVLAPPALRVSDLVVVPDTPAAGVPANVVVSLENRGGATGTATVAILVDGAAAGNLTATVPGGLTRALAFPLTFQGPGNATVEVRVASDHLALGAPTTVEHAVQVRPAPATTPGASTLPVPGPGPVLVVLVVALLALRRREAPGR